MAADPKANDILEDVVTHWVKIPRTRFEQDYGDWAGNFARKFIDYNSTPSQVRRLLGSKMTGWDQRIRSGGAPAGIVAGIVDDLYTQVFPNWFKRAFATNPPKDKNGPVTFVPGTKNR
jgi:hypothetical protein